MDEQRGRCIVAKRDFEEGEQLFFDNPLITWSSSRRSENKTQCCPHCESPIPNITYNSVFQSGLVPEEVFEDIFGEEKSVVIRQLQNELELPSQQKRKCSTCNAIYCSTDCLEMDSVHHSYLCTGVSEFNKIFALHCNENGGDTSQFIAKILAMLKSDEELLEWSKQHKADPELDNQEDVAEANGEDDFKFVLDRFCYVPNDMPVLAESEKEQLNILKHIFPKLTETDYFKLKSIINLNALEFSVCQTVFGAKIVNQQDVSIETGHIEVKNVSGLFPLASLLNHSCVPNVAMQFPVLDAESVTFVASKPIRKGEELFWCYYSNDNHQKRREYLMRHYYFDCKCEKCLKQ